MIDRGALLIPRGMLQDLPGPHLVEGVSCVLLSFSNLLSMVANLVEGSTRLEQFRAAILCIGSSSISWVNIHNTVRSLSMI